MRNERRKPWSAAGILACAIIANAATLPYQGLATDSKGNPYADGSHPVVFSLYGAASGGTSLWSETQTVATSKGLFSTSLGAVKVVPDNLFNGSALYLGVAFDGGAEGGRLLLGTPPWAKASDSSRASHVADSAKAVAGLGDSVSLLRAKIRTDSTSQAAQLASNLSTLNARHVADSVQIYMLQSMLAPPPSSGIPWQSAIVYGSLTDTRDGQVYRTVRIGNQVWMAQNLNFAGTGSTIGVCYSGSNDSCAKYGRLYMWSEAMANAASSTSNPSGVQGVCPTGWHVPSDSEWTTLRKFVDPTSTTDGTKLKSTGGWLPNGTISGNGKDTYGFRALPGGGSNARSVGISGNWWTASDTILSNATYLGMFNSTTNVSKEIDGEINDLSLRCAQD